VALFAPRTLVAVVASVAFLVAPAAVRAGDAGDPYKTIVVTVPSPYWGYTYAPYVSPLHGIAAIISAEGDYLIKREQAISMRLDNRLKYLKVRKEELQHLEWERDFRLGSLNRKLAAEKKESLTYSLEHATDAELIHAKPQNFLLEHLKKRSDLTAAGSIAIEPEWLKHTYTSADNYSNLGLLADEKELQYRIPPLLLRPEFYGEIKEIQELLIAAKNVALLRQSQTREGAEKLHKVRQRVEQCKAHVARENKKTETADRSSRWTDYIKANRLLEEIDANIAALESPNAAILVQPLEGKTVYDLVMHMKKNDLRFSKAHNGDEHYFRVLYHALVAEVKRLDSLPKNP
jgi:hypothetical protein